MVIKNQKMHLDEVKIRALNKRIFFYLPVFFLAMACGNSRRPGLSDKELFARRKAGDAPPENGRDRCVF